MDLWRPIGVLREQERTPDGHATVAAVFLAGAECPFTCVFCDLWKYTSKDRTPDGALPAQIESALAEVGPLPPDSRVKLYNAGNFFDARAVPVADLPRIADLLGGFSRIIVECHPKLVGESLFSFAAQVEGRLEVALGLESIHPDVLPRLNKKMSKEDYDQATESLIERGIPHRSFVLVGAPFLAGREGVDWAVVTAAYAVERGAETVTLIPVRGGNGELERLAVEGQFRQPRLSELEEAFDRALVLPGAAILQADLWDLESFSSCDLCLELRVERLERMNLSGVVEERVQCTGCAERAL